MIKSLAEREPTDYPERYGSTRGLEDVDGVNEALGNGPETARNRVVLPISTVPPSSSIPERTEILRACVWRHPPGAGED